MKVNLWWIRRDLRLADNQALYAAMEDGSAVIPLFILDPALLSSPQDRADHVTGFRQTTGAFYSAFIYNRLFATHNVSAIVLQGVHFKAYP